MKIATLATGGIGGFLAVGLTEAGHEVGCIARGAHLEAIRRDGLTLTHHGESRTVRVWRAEQDAAAIGPVDAVIFGVKADDLDSAAALCQPLLGPDTVVVPFLNGVEAADRLAALLPPGSVGNGVSYVSTTISAPGVIGRTGDFGRFLIAERDNRASSRIDALRQAIRDAGADAPDVTDIDRESWIKFVAFSAMSGVTAAGRCTIGTVRDTPELSRLFRDVMTETAAVAAARGVVLPDDLIERHWRFVESMPAEARASTAVDLERGRPIETRWLNGAVVRLGKAAGVDVPANRALAAVLAPYTLPG